MVLEYVRYVVPAERSDEFEAAYGRAQEALSVSEHCRRWELARGVEEPENYILRIEWDSLEGHEQGFRGSPEFKGFFEAVKPFFGQIQEMKHYEVTGVAGGS